MATVTDTPVSNKAGHDTTRPVSSTQEVRQGEAPGRVRLVLFGGLALAAIAGVVIWSIFFL